MPREPESSAHKLSDLSPYTSEGGVSVHLL